MEKWANNIPKKMLHVLNKRAAFNLISWENDEARRRDIILFADLIILEWRNGPICSRSPYLDLKFKVIGKLWQDHWRHKLSYLHTKLVGMLNLQDIRDILS
jgi:hypothetical protein